MKSDAALHSLIEGARRRDKFAVAQLISLFEQEGQDSVALKKQALKALADNDQKTKAASEAAGEWEGLAPQKGVIFGFAGAPGSGKSTLLGSLAKQIFEKDSSLSLAILAVDPSSQYSRGAILGDRTRLKHYPDSDRLFFRSQAAADQLGGLGPHSYSVARLLVLLFDLVFVETVGVGQSEIEIKELADFTFLVIQPFAGDQLQFIKAGIMEVPDAFIVNKADDVANSQKSFHQLKHGLTFLNINAQALPPIFLSSSISRQGIDELSDYIILCRKEYLPNLIIEKNQQRIQYFINKAITQRYGQWGLGLSKKLEEDHRSLIFEERLQRILGEIAKHIQ